MVCPIRVVRGGGDSQGQWARGGGHSHLIRLREKRESLKGSVYSTRTKLKFVKIQMICGD